MVASGKIFGFAPSPPPKRKIKGCDGLVPSEKKKTAAFGEGRLEMKRKYKRFNERENRNAEPKRDTAGQFHPGSLTVVHRLFFH